MHSQAYLAAACALLGAVAASPAPRGLDTVTHIDWVTEIVTSTVWVDAGDPRATQTPAPVSSASAAQNNVVSEHQSHSHGSEHSHGHESSSSSSSAVVASSTPVVVPAAISSSSSVVPAAAPTTTSTSAVAPPPPPPTTTLATSTTPAPVLPASSTTTTQAANAPNAPAPASSSPAAASPSGTTGSVPSGAYKDVKLTYYDPNGGYGSCGSILHNSDLTVAVAGNIMDKGSMCGRKIIISYGGHQTTATVADTCPGCQPNGLDLTSYDTPTGPSTGMWKAAVSDKQDAGTVSGADWWFV